jgi:hypothetical protein
LLIDPTLALITPLPAVKLWTSPVLSTDITFELEELQATPAVRALDVPSEYVPVAVS